MAKLSWDELRTKLHNRQVKILILDEQPEEVNGMWIPSKHLESLGLSFLAPKGGGIVIPLPGAEKPKPKPKPKPGSLKAAADSGVEIKSLRAKKPKPGVLMARGGGPVLEFPKPTKPPKKKNS